MNRRTFTGGLALVLLAAVAPLWAAASLNGAGASFPYPLYSKWFDVYQKKTGVKINYQSIGSGGGIKQLKEKTVDFGASDAPLSAEEEKGMPGAVVHIPMAGGAVAVILNVKGVTKPIHLDSASLAGIFLGKITDWNDKTIAGCNPGVTLPAQKITVVHRSDGSGTTYIFTDYVEDISAEWKTNVGKGKSVKWPCGVGAKGNEGVAQMVKETPGAIGYAELAYSVQNKLVFATLKNRAGQWVAPSLKSTTAAIDAAAKTLKANIKASVVNQPGAASYPIVGVTYILAYTNQADKEKGAALKALLNWANTSGQEYCDDLLYAALPAALVAQNKDAIASIK